MSISWRVNNASSIANLEGDAMPFMLKVAILIEAIRSNCGRESLFGCATLVLLLVRSRRIPTLFSNLIFLFGDGGLPRFVRFRVFIRRVGCAVRGYCVLVVQPLCTSDVCHHFLSGAFFSLRVCMQVSRSLSG